MSKIIPLPDFRNRIGAGMFFGIMALLFFPPKQIHAQQFPSDLWHEGKIVLLEGDTLRGNVKYDLQQDLVQYSVANQRTTAFSARKVLFFEIFDTSVRKYRQFFALPYSTTSSYKAPVFFELLEEGKMTLLSRESVEYRTYNSPYYMGSYSRLVLVYKYFFLDENGNISEFNGNKNDLLNLMNKKSEEVEKYIKSNKLKYDEKYDFARIVAYYNSLFGT
ncbi:hypothetical protein [Chryseolinea sp. H1M3-3]|uniref:hypothetical protein n=1 Tax=Chryseolinea sp. H1M3-3 TaxID=3034144 RepID=UPI0023EADCC5|nr:hypothetical protein [Chryseolinea sp. H1M3-3]